MRLASKLFLLYALICLFIIISSGVYYVGSRQALLREEQQLSNKLSNQVREMLSSQLSSTMNQIFDNYNLTVLLGNNLIGQSEDGNRDQYINQVRGVLINFLARAAEVNWVAVVDVNDEVFAIARDHLRAIPYDYAGNLAQDKQICQDYAARLVYRVLEDGTINISRIIYNLSTMRYTGYVIVNINASKFLQTLSALDDLPGSSAVIYDSFDHPMLYTLEPALEPALAMDLYDAGSLKLGRDTWILNWKEITNSDLKFCYILNVGAASQQLQNLTICYIAVFLAVLGLISAVTLIISRQINKNVLAVHQGLQAISAGNLDFHIQPTAMDEIGEISLGVNRMAADIKALIAKAQQEEKNRQQLEYQRLESQYSALQSQINPHMLFNALESINAMAKLHGNKDISDFSCSFAQLLRLNLERGGTCCPLSDELKYIELYVSVYRESYPSAIELDLDVDHDLDDVAVPVFVLQPIVENAIVHGLSPKPHGGHIRITVSMEDDALCIRVADDGVGITPEQARQINGSLGGTGSHFGLRNVQQRIHFLYGEEYGLHMMPGPQSGTVAALRLPV